MISPSGCEPSQEIQLNLIKREEIMSKQFIDISMASMIFWRCQNHKAEGHPTMAIFIEKLIAPLEAGSGDARKGPFVNLDTSEGAFFLIQKDFDNFGNED